MQSMGRRWGGGGELGHTMSVRGESGVVQPQAGIAPSQGDIDGDVAEEVSGGGGVVGGAHSAGDGTAYGSGDRNDVLCQPP